MRPTDAAMKGEEHSAKSDVTNSLQLELNSVFRKMQNRHRPCVDIGNLDQVKSGRSVKYAAGCRTGLATNGITGVQQDVIKDGEHDSKTSPFTVSKIKHSTVSRMPSTEDVITADHTRVNGYNDSLGAIQAVECLHKADACSPSLSAKQNGCDDHIEEVCMEPVVFLERCDILHENMSTERSNLGNDITEIESKLDVTGHGLDVNLKVNYESNRCKREGTLQEGWKGCTSQSRCNQALSEESDMTEPSLKHRLTALLPVQRPPGSSHVLGHFGSSPQIGSSLPIQGSSRSLRAIDPFGSSKEGSSGYSQDQLPCGSSQAIQLVRSSSSLRSRGTYVFSHGFGSSQTQISSRTEKTKGFSGSKQTSSGYKQTQGSSGSKQTVGSSGSELIQGSSGSKQNQGSSESKQTKGSSGSKQIEGSSGSKQNQGSSESKQNQGSSGSKQIQGSSGSKQIEGSSRSKQIEGSSESKQNQGSSGSKQNQGSSESKQNQGSSESKQNQESSESKHKQGSSESKQIQGSSGSKQMKGSSGSKQNQGSSVSKQTQGFSSAKNIQGSSRSSHIQGSSQTIGPSKSSHIQGSSQTIGPSTSSQKQGSSGSKPKQRANGSARVLGPCGPSSNFDQMDVLHEEMCSLSLSESTDFENEVTRICENMVKGDVSSATHNSQKSNISDCVQSHTRTISADDSSASGGYIYLWDGVTHLPPGHPARFLPLTVGGSTCGTGENKVCEPPSGRGSRNGVNVFDAVAYMKSNLAHNSTVKSDWAHFVENENKMLECVRCAGRVTRSTSLATGAGRSDKLHQTIGRLPLRKSRSETLKKPEHFGDVFWSDAGCSSRKDVQLSTEPRSRNSAVRSSSEQICRNRSIGSANEHLRKTHSHDERVATLCHTHHSQKRCHIRESSEVRGRRGRKFVFPSSHHVGAPCQGRTSSVHRITSSSSNNRRCKNSLRHHGRNASFANICHDIGTTGPHSKHRRHRKDARKYKSKTSTIRNDGADIPDASAATYVNTAAFCDFADFEDSLIRYVHVNDLSLLNDDIRQRYRLHLDGSPGVVTVAPPGACRLRRFRRCFCCHRATSALEPAAIGSSKRLLISTRC